MNQTPPVKPNNHMVMAIVSTVLSVITCAFVYVIPIVGGIVSIVFASQVNSKYNAGNYEGAEKSSKYAKIAWIVSIVVLAVYLIVLAYQIATSGDELMEQINKAIEQQKELQGQ